MEAIETAHGLGEIEVSETGRTENTPGSAGAGSLNEYIEKAYGEFLESQRRLENTIRTEENKAVQDYRSKEEKFLEEFQISLEQAIQTHEKAITLSIRAYESALKNAAQAFITSKEEAAQQYLETFKMNSQELKRLMEEARSVRDTEIDACHRIGARR